VFEVGISQYFSFMSTELIENDDNDNLRQVEVLHEQGFAKMFDYFEFHPKTKCLDFFESGSSEFENIWIRLHK
jgi:hypothetical protein